jgi:hypothetical protein
LTAFFREQVLAGSGDSGHDRPHQQGDGAAHSIELPSTTLAALRILAIAADYSPLELAQNCRVYDNFGFRDFIEPWMVPFVLTEYEGEYVGIARKV